MPGSGFLSELERICGGGHVITDAHGLRVYGVGPRAAVLPGTPEEVQRVVGACAEHGVSFAVRGAGTGPRGPAPVSDPALLIVLSRLRRIVAVDLDGGRVIAEAGVTPAQIDRAVAPSHRFAPDLDSGGFCTVGGAVATDARGPRSARHATVGDAVLGLDVVLADGTAVTLGREPPGYDLVAAFIGSGGSLGVAVRVHLRVLPSPETSFTFLALFELDDRAAAAAGAVRDDGLEPAALELLGPEAVRIAGRREPGCFRPQARAALLIEIEGPAPEAGDRFERALALCEQAGAADLRVATDPGLRRRLWRAVRGACPPAPTAPGGGAGGTASATVAA